MHKENYTGLACPEPVIRCRSFLASCENGQELNEFIVFVDNEPASENMARFLRANSYEVAVEEENNTLWTLSAKKKASSSKADNAQTQSINKDVSVNNSNNNEQTKILIIIPAEIFGSGDDTLGAKLMDNFLSTLPELGTNLWKVILLNGGVKLAAQVGAALDSLIKLENEGIEILVCGSCLEFYGLTKERKVGQTTNMLDIMTSIDLADKVLRV